MPLPTVAFNRSVPTPPLNWNTVAIRGSYTHNVYSEIRVKHTYEFTLALDREPTEAEVEALFEPFDGSAVAEFGNGTGIVHVHYAGDTLADAISESIVKVETVGLAVTGVQSEDAVSINDIAAADHSGTSPATPR